MNDYTRKKDYFYQIKQLIINILDSITYSFESNNSDPKAIDQAIRFMDQYYDCIQYVKSDYLPNEIKFNNSKIIGQSKSLINHIVANNDCILACSNNAILYKQQNTILLDTPEIEIYTGLILQDGRILLGGEDKILRVYNQNYKLVQQLDGFLKCINMLITSHDEQLIGVCTLTSLVQILDSSLNRLYTIHSTLSIVYALSFSVQNHYIATACKKGLCIWEIVENKLLHLNQQITLPNKVRSVAFSKKQKFLALTNKNQIFLYHYYVEDFKKYQTLIQHTDIVNCVQFIDKGLISGSDDCTICLWSSTIKGYWICYQTLQNQFCVNSISITKHGLYCDCLEQVVQFY